MPKARYVMDCVSVFFSTGRAFGTRLTGYSGIHPSISYWVFTGLAFGKGGSENSDFVPNT